MLLDQAFIAMEEAEATLSRVECLRPKRLTVKVLRAPPACS